MDIANRTEWFQHVMAEREQFFDLGYTAIYIDNEKHDIVIFWKCVNRGEEQWPS